MQFLWLRTIRQFAVKVETNAYRTSSDEPAERKFTKYIL
jgi:hypothetical protein